MFKSKSKTITISLDTYERLVKEAADVQIWKERGDRYAAFNDQPEKLLAEQYNQNISVLKDALSLLKEKKP